MQCPACQFDNREGRRFCGRCGGALALTCSACGFQNDPDDHFCGGCGAALGVVPEAADAVSPAEPEPAAESAEESQAERRQVTILFADLVGFTALSRRHDPEEVHGLLNRLFAVIDGIAASYGGRIDKHIGDAAMAVFGVPVAHGNDVERAARAALDMHAAMEALSSEIGAAMRLHIGIASGQVVASGLGGDGSEYTVTGTSVNLAARLVERAAPGETLLSDAAHRGLTHLARVEPVGEIPVKGFDRDVRVWRLLSLDLHGPRQMEIPLAGRRAELRQFRGVLEGFRESGVGQAIYARGEAGIGKSRLVHEFAALAADEGFECHTGLCLDFGVGRGQDAIRGIVRSLFGLAADADLDLRTKAVERALAEGWLDRRQRVFLHDLLDVPQDAAQRAMYDAMDNENRNRGKQTCVVDLVSALCRLRPLMIVVEDLHWAGPLTLSYLALLTAAVTEVPLLVVMTSRIEGDPLDRAWRQSAGSPPLLTLDLGPLRHDEALALAGQFVGASKRLALRSVERAEGNPLFLEQLLRGAASGEEEEVPGTVQSIVLARVDRLSAADRRALQAAAVLGQRFRPDVLRHLIDDGDYDCGKLVEHYLVRPAGAEYLFSHALIRESIYASILRESRAQLHQRAASWFSNRDPGLHSEHLDRAGDPAAAGAYREAAVAQARSFHFERALSLADRGLAIAGPGDRFELLMAKGEFLREIGRPADSITVYRDALQAAEQDVERCRARIGLVSGMRVTDEFDEALRMLDLAEELGRAQDLALELSQVHYYRGNLYFPLGNIEGCLEQHRLALEHAKRAGSAEAEARALSGLGDAWYSQGRMITALDHFRQCIELCRAHGFGRIEVGNQYMIAWGRLYLNEVEGALSDAFAAVEAAARVGARRAEMVARLTVGRILVEKGDPEAAEPHVQRGLELAESLGARRFKPFLMIYLARLRLARFGRQAETERLMQEAFEISEATGTGFLGPWVLGTLALVSRDPAVRADALARGEAILAQGCVGHNHFAFRRAAIEVALEEHDWDRAEAQAQALADYSAREPLPFADFFIARGRALAAHGRAPGPTAELRRIDAEARTIGLLAALPAIEQALVAAI
jgi:class 3 adenylate cyclase/tetratricopeptide (TPR) repeat protein